MKKYKRLLVVLTALALILSLSISCTIEVEPEAVVEELAKSTQNILIDTLGGVAITVYLKDNISDNLKESIERKIKSWEEVKEVKYVSEEEAFEKFKEQNKGSDILKEIEVNPLPASFEIKLKNYKKVEQVALRFIDKDGNYIEGIEDVIY